MKRLFTRKLSVPAREEQAREEWTEGCPLRRAGRGTGTEEERAFWDQHAFVPQLRNLSLGLPRAHGKPVTKQVLFGEACEAHRPPGCC